MSTPVNISGSVDRVDWLIAREEDGKLYWHFGHMPKREIVWSPEVSSLILRVQELEQDLKMCCEHVVRASDAGAEGINPFFESWVRARLEGKPDPSLPAA